MGCEVSDGRGWKFVLLPLPPNAEREGELAEGEERGEGCCKPVLMCGGRDSVEW